MALKFRDPDTGLSIEVKGDVAPSEQELDALFAAAQAQQPETAAPRGIDTGQPAIEQIPPQTEQIPPQIEQVPTPADIAAQGVGPGEAALITAGKGLSDFPRGINQLLGSIFETGVDMKLNNLQGVATKFASGQYIAPHELASAGIPAGSDPRKMEELITRQMNQIATQRQDIYQKSSQLASEQREAQQLIEPLKEKHPISAYGGEILGKVAPSLLIPGATGTLPAQIATGAGIGVTEGLLEPVTGETPEERAAQRQENMLIGGGAGGVLPVVFKGIKGLWDYGKRALRGADEAPATRVVDEAVESTAIPQDELAALRGADIAETERVAAGIPEDVARAERAAAREAEREAEQGATRAAMAEREAVETAERQTVETGITDAVEAIRKATPEELAEIVQADPGFYRAAEELDINVEPIASFASNNPLYRDVEGALKSVPGSELSAQGIRFIEATSRKADELIEQYGGTLDKGQLSQDFKREALATIDDLAEQADEVYSELRALIPPQNRFSAPDTMAFLEEKALEMGGVENLPPLLAKMYEQLRPRETDEGLIEPTLGLIDFTRGQIGEALTKYSGPFMDIQTGIRKALYGRLASDQNRIAQITGNEGIARAGNRLITQRKQLEDNVTSLLGKDVNRALNVTVGGALKNLSKNEIDRFNAVVRAIPANQRERVVLSAMNDVFKGRGVGQTSLSPSQFTKWYKTISRSPATKSALFAALPRESKKAIENLYKLSEGITRAQGQVIPTGRINNMFNPSAGFLRNLAGNTASMAVRMGTFGSPLASAIADPAIQFIKQGSDNAVKSAKMVASPRFQNIVRESVKEGVDAGATPSPRLQRMLQDFIKLPAFTKWVETLDVDNRIAAQTDLLAYLYSGPETSEPQTQTQEQPGQ